MASKVALFFIFIVCLSIWNRSIPSIFKRFRPQRAKGRIYLLEKLLHYGGNLGLTFMILHWYGVDLNSMLATAGVLTVTVGFAAKTSISHLISGLILLGAKFFKQGDLIEVGEYLGVVENIDVFSTRLRTFDNVLVSIPNEKLLTECVSNFSEYPIRRITAEFSINPDDISSEMITTLKSHICTLHAVLIEPAPLVILEDDLGRGVKLGVRAWCESQRIIESRNQLILFITEFLKSNHVRYGGEVRYLNDSSYCEGFPIDPQP